MIFGVAQKFSSKTRHVVCRRAEISSSAKSARETSLKKEKLKCVR